MPPPPPAHLVQVVLQRPQHACSHLVVPVDVVDDGDAQRAGLGLRMCGWVGQPVCGAWRDNAGEMRSECGSGGEAAARAVGAARRVMSGSAEGVGSAWCASHARVEGVGTCRQGRGAGGQSTSGAASKALCTHGVRSPGRCAALAGVQPWQMVHSGAAHTL